MPREDRITAEAFLSGLRRDFDEALEGSPSVLFTAKLTLRVAVFGERAGPGAKVLLDFQERDAAMLNTLELDVEPSPITRARLQAEADRVRLALLSGEGGP